MAPSPVTPSAISKVWTRKTIRYPLLAAVALLIFLSTLSSSDVRAQVRGTGQRVTSYFDDEATRYSKINTLKDFASNDKCKASTQDLYKSTQPLCKDRPSLMNAMSYGGRVGFEAPYQTRGCDMRWYDTSGICSIMSKFDVIYLIGDSMTRHLAQAFNIFLREDLVEGARATWRNKDGDGPPGLNCRCHTVIDHKSCMLEGYAAVGTEEVMRHAPETFKCKQDFAKVVYLLAPDDPPNKENLTTIMDTIRTNRDSGNTRAAYIIGQGIWNSFSPPRSKHYLRILEGVIADPSSFPSTPTPAQIPGDHPPKIFHQKHHPRLYIPPVAVSLHKPQWKIDKTKQNNIALQNFEREMEGWVEGRGWDQLGMFNASVQSVGWDGTHATMETNLIKTMMVLNWLDWVAPGEEAEGEG